jgi:hypothetical protein
VGHLGQVVDLLLGEPGLLVLEREYLDGHLLLAQLTLPHRAEPASRLDLQQLYGPKQEAVKKVAGLKSKDYYERYQELGLETLEQRRKKQDLVLVHS